MRMIFLIFTSLTVVGVKAVSEKFLYLFMFFGISQVLEVDGFDNRILRTRFSGSLYCCSKNFITFPSNVNGRDYLVTSRMDEAKNLIHIEVREQSPVRSKQGSFMNQLSLLASQFTNKPIIAKTGYRPDSTLSTDNLETVLMNEFNESDKQIPISIFVYMWVAPEFRGKGFGDFLLRRVIKECIDRGDKYMIIVHDDNGSGKLIQYYKKRNFREIFEFLDKGMICKFPPSLPTFDD